MKFIFLMLLSLSAFAGEFTPIQRVTGMAVNVKQRIIDNNLPLIHNVELAVSVTLKEPSQYEFDKAGVCWIYFSPKWALNSSNDELAFVISMQYAHCLYKDDHVSSTEADYWFKIYRADTFASRLFPNNGLQSLCLGEPDTPYRPSCERRMKATTYRQGQTYRSDERSSG